MLSAIKSYFQKISAHFPERKRLLYLPRLFSQQEKIIFLALLLVAISAGTFSLTRFVIQRTEQVPELGGTYREGLLKQPRLINPLFLASNDTDRDLAKLIYSSLITFDTDGNPVLDLAEKYEITDDEKTYTFFLRENARWHDGKPITADDIVFTIQTVQNTAYASPERPNWQGVEVQKLNNYTVSFTLRQPYAPFINNLTLGILPKHLWENIDPLSAPLHELNLRPVGSGPYVLSETEKTEDIIARIILTANPRYHREGPYLKRIEFLFFPSEEELAQSFHSGSIDGAGEIPAEHFERNIPQGIAPLVFNMPNVFGIFLNANKLELLADKDVRLALAHALDTERIRKEAAGDDAKETHTPIPANIFGLNPDIAPISYDPEKAKTILEKEGYKANEDGTRVKKEKKSGKEIVTPLRIKLATSNAPQLVRAAELIKDMWSAVGVSVEITALPVIELESTLIRPRAYETLLFGEVYSHDPDPFSFWHSSQIKDPGLNIAMYSNRKVDELLADARKTADRATRRKKYEEFEKIVTDDIAAIFLYSPSYKYFVSEKIKGVRGGTMVLPSDRFNEITRWFISTDRVWK